MFYKTEKKCPQSVSLLSNPNEMRWLSDMEAFRELRQRR